MRYGFEITAAQVAPLDLDLYGEAARLEFWRRVVAHGLAEKDAELAKGFDRFGRPMTPISTYTRKHRTSWTGKADPNAPPLTPGYAGSRTRVLLEGRAMRDRAEFFWLADPTTGKPWGRMLAIHRAGNRRLPVRDVIGISPGSLGRVRRAAGADWERIKRGVAARATAEKRRKAQPFQGVRQAPERIKLVGRIDLRNFTFGIGASRSSVERAIRAGTSTGFRVRKGAD